jgi:hypothetical protein
LTSLTSQLATPTFPHMGWTTSWRYMVASSNGFGCLKYRDISLSTSHLNIVVVICLAGMQEIM